VRASILEKNCAKETIEPSNLVTCNDYSEYPSYYETKQSQRNATQQDIAKSIIYKQHFPAFRSTTKTTKNPKKKSRTSRFPCSTIDPKSKGTALAAKKVQ
jgi:hypothetical protein